ncbi:hypothetical protein MC52_006680 [Klebsiella michiganensis]|uniref:Uncharacterized protein n=1 Tax=Klebsiella michiganensis TaxID=1134687 RepID=A0A2J5PEF2_9ENTR|nr:hypothetical protein AM355_25165 [Klebsiella oxytoca]PLO64105.1 hypothetical protein CWN49_26210 [Klebsiella michiganensis]PNO42294.1 hypothetical protein MC52_006680 [Klebsiella michiganensis]
MFYPRLYPSYSRSHGRWLRSFTRITYPSKLIGRITRPEASPLTGPAQALFKTVNRFVLRLELFRV